MANNHKVMQLQIILFLAMFLQPFIENVIKEFGRESIGEDVPVMLSGQLQHCSVSNLELA